jgi:cell wall assembly regulator SMI1
MNCTSSVGSTWRRIKSWLEANLPQLIDALEPGATLAELDAAEKLLGTILPRAARDSYLTHSGQKQDTPGLIDGWELLSLSRVVSQWRVWSSLLHGGAFADSVAAPEAGICSVWWSERWIPVTYDGHGNHECIDMGPSTEGSVGQIIRVWHDDPRRSVVANGYEAWLGSFADGLDAGRYVYSDDYGGLILRER